MKNKYVAALLALLFGIFGVHRFYLGQTMWGVLSILFCFTGIPALLGFIDSILFLAMDTAEFDYKYNGKYMETRDYDRGGRQPIRRNRRGREEVRDREFKRMYGAPATRASSSKRKIVPKKNPFKESGIAKYKQYDFDGAIEDFHKALKVNERDLSIHFNLACANSITEQKEDAFYHLAKAVEYGFNDVKRIKEHDGLAFLRIQPEYQEFEKNGYQLVGEMDDPQKNIKESSNLLEQLQKLAELRDKGLLTNEEFAKQKQKLLK